MTLTELEQLVPEWQEILRIQDWRIKVLSVGKDEIDGEQAHTSYIANSKTAVIKIIREQDYDAARWLEPFDPEAILVHEMKHLQFYMVDKEDCPEFEFAIDASASALVGLRRRLCAVQ